MPWDSTQCQEHHHAQYQHEHPSRIWIREDDTPIDNQGLPLSFC